MLRCQEQVSLPHLLIIADCNVSVLHRHAAAPLTNDDNAFASRCDGAAAAPLTSAYHTALHGSALLSEGVAPTTLVSPRSSASNEATPTYLSDDAPM